MQAETELENETKQRTEGREGGEGLTSPDTGGKESKDTGKDRENR